jgi:hypothetical protein
MTTRPDTAAIPEDGTAIIGRAERPDAIASERFGRLRRQVGMRGWTNDQEIDRSRWGSR